MSENAPIKATLKGGVGYDAPWITLDADNPSELEAKAKALAESGAVQAVVELANLFKGVNNAAPLLAGGQAQSVSAPSVPPQGQPAPPQQSAWGQQAAPVQQAAPAQQAGGPVNGQPHPENKQCACGTVLQWKAFTSKAGKNLKMWTCPNGRSQGDGHDSEFVW